jgi:hypothetical protein
MSAGHSSMPWSDVVSKLQARYADLDASRLERWLARLGETEAGMHLGTNVLIDLESKIADEGLYVRILNDLDVNAPHPVHEFWRVTDRIFWPEVVAKLRSSLAALGVERLDRWIARLAETEAGKHLGICILIDMLANIVDARVFVRVLQNLNTDALDAVKEFGRAID